jgi:hypothetical protein
MPQIINSPVDDYVFVETEQKTIVIDNESISSSIGLTETSIFDGIDRNDTIKLILSFESYSQQISVLKSISIYRLLNNKQVRQQLHVNIPVDECALVLEESNNQILTRNDTLKPLSEYPVAANQSINIRISILIQITKNDDQQQIKIPITNRKTTIQEILQLTNQSTDMNKYLASSITKCIISNDEYISNLNQTKFILVTENETCLVSIQIPNESLLIKIDNETNQYQRFITSATISDIYKQNKIDTEHQFFLYSDDFIPSPAIPLTSFLVASPIQFTIIENNLPITVTIFYGEHSVKFSCSHSMKVKRLYQIGCQLFSVKPDYYQLWHLECLLDDDDMSLEDVDSSMTNPQFQLVCKATLNSSVTYLDQKVVFPCASKTGILDIVTEAFTKLHISQEDINIYELIAMDDSGTATQIDFEMTMDDVLSLFTSPDITTIPFQLNKKK